MLDCEVVVSLSSMVEACKQSGDGQQRYSRRHDLWHG